FVQRRVNVLVATGGEASAVAAKQATSTIPIAFVTGDPVKAGLVASLNRPGGDATGSYFTTTEMGQKRPSLLPEIPPGGPAYRRPSKSELPRCRESIASA